MNGQTKKSQLTAKVSENTPVLEPSNVARTKAYITAISIHDQRPASVIRRSGEGVNQFILDVIDVLEQKAKKAWSDGYRAGRSSAVMGRAA